MEEEYIQQICEDIIRLKPDLVFTEKGISGTSHLVDHMGSTWFSWFTVCSSGSVRSGPALPGEGQHHRHPPRQEDRQQPHRQVSCCSQSALS